MLDNNYCVYLAHTNTDIYYESLFSILSFIKNDPEGRATILIYTDNPDFFTSKMGTFSKYDIVYTPVSSIRKWSGEINYIHRVKIETLLEASRVYQGNILYLDSDTFVNNPVQGMFDKIQNKQLVMHRLEAKFATHKGR